MEFPEEEEELTVHRWMFSFTFTSLCDCVNPDANKLTLSVPPHLDSWKFDLALTWLSFEDWTHDSQMSKLKCSVILNKRPSPVKLQNEDVDASWCRISAQPVSPCKRSLCFAWNGGNSDNLIVLVTEQAALSESLSYTSFSYFTPFCSLFTQLPGRASWNCLTFNHCRLSEVPVWLSAANLLVL